MFSLEIDSLVFFVYFKFRKFWIICFHNSRLNLLSTVSFEFVNKSKHLLLYEMSSPSKPTEPAASIDDLPPEMICELFEYLQPKDLAACSMVNKRWHSIYGGFRMHRLVAVDYDNWYYDLGKWYNSNQAIREERSHLKIFRLLAEKPLLSNLKHLALSGELDLNELNRFRQLVHLEIKIGFSSKKCGCAKHDSLVARSPLFRKPTRGKHSALLWRAHSNIPQSYIIGQFTSSPVRVLGSNRKPEVS